MDVSSHTLTRELFNLHPIPSFIFDKQGNILMLNTAGEQMLSSLPGIRLQTGANFLKSVNREYRFRFEAHLVECISRGNAKLKDLQMGSDDDSPLWLRLNSVLMETPLSGIEAAVDQPLILSAAIDISESRRSEDALLLAQNQAEKARKQQSIFLRQISHEIRSPLKSLTQLSELMHESITEGQFEAARNLNNTVSRITRNLGNMVDDLLDLSLIDEEKLELRHEPFSIENIVKDLHDINTPMARRKGLGFYIREHLTTPGVFQGDQRRIKQVLNILISNAVEYTPEGQVDIILREEVLSDYLSELSAEVRDTGTGIPSRIQHEVWEGIYSDGEHQAGMGLPIAKRLSRLMKGQLYFETTLHMGTSFFFTIPLPRLNDDSSLQIYEARQNRSKNLRILAGIQHSSSWQDLISSLGEDGHIVVSSESRIELESLLELNKFDVVLLDEIPGSHEVSQLTEELSEERGSSSNAPILIALGNRGQESSFSADYVLPPDSSSDDLYHILSGIINSR